MNIIIVGCGKVGYTLVEQLGLENHNISVIDLKEDRVKAITDELDAQGVIGNGVSYQTLQEAGIATADLLIAVTESDEQNLLCCCIAKKAGHCKTIARVRNPIYNDEISFLRDELGLAMVINPEQTCADEIARIFQYPSAVKIDTFSKGRLEMMHFRITADCLLNNYVLANIRSKLGCDVIVCIVTRGEEVIIPRGDFVFMEGDMVAFVATPSKAAEFFRKIGISTGRTRTAMLAGGGEISYYLAKRLTSVGIQTKIIENQRDRCEELSEKLPNATLIWGDATDEKLLLQEGLENVEGFAALTNLDEENILLSLMVKKLSKAKIVTKINRINFNRVLDDMLIDTTTFPRLLTADRILRYVRSMDSALGENVENLYRLEDGRAEALEFLVNGNSPVIGIPIAKLNLKNNLTICSITRGNQIIFPTGTTEIQKDDYVVIVTTHKGMKDISDILSH